MATQYLHLVGILRWAVELGRIDIATKVSGMLQHNAAPHVGHLEAVNGIFYYLSKHDVSQIPFDGFTTIGKRNQASLVLWILIMQAM
eukprot:5281220-Ditylum_brightwellii.AAC.1